MFATLDDLVKIANAYVPMPNVPGSQAFDPQNIASSGIEAKRKKIDHTDKEVQDWLEGRVKALRDDLRNTGAFNSLAGFVLSCLHFEKAFPHIVSREAIETELAKAAKDVKGWDALDAADKEKIQRTYRDWDSGIIEAKKPGDGWHAVRIPPEVGQARKSLKDRLLTVEKLMNMPLPAPLIKGVLDLESATWLIAQPGGFKSFVALDWSCHVATGKEWRGRKTKKAPVVYVLAEGKGNFRKRVQAWITRNGVTPDQLYVLPVAVQARGKDKTVSEEWRELVELVKEIQPGLVVLDTQARLTVGMEENNNTEMGVWVKAVDALKEAVNACVLVVHHTGRNGGDARGGSALDGAQDAEWRVDRKAHKLAMTLSCDKNKDGDDRTAIDFVMDVVNVGTDEDGATITSLVLGEAKEHNAFTDAQEADKEGLDAILARGGGIRCRDLVLGIVRSLDGGQGLTRAEVQRLGNEALKEHPSRERVKAYAEGSYRKAIKDLIDDGQLEGSDDATPRYSTLE